MKRTCSIDGCNKGAHARQLCSTHYSRLLRSGVTDDPRKVSVAKRFWARVEKTPTCWLWTGGKSPAGYGMLWVASLGHLTTAHRVSYELLVGEIPDGWEVDHRCHQRACVNPEHLQAVTHQKNGENRSGASAISSTGVRGVWYDSNRQSFGVDVKVYGRKHFGGRYDTLEEAEAAAIALRNRLMTNNLADRTA